MAEPFLLIDAGNTAAKFQLREHDGRLVGSGRRPYADLASALPPGPGRLLLSSVLAAEREDQLLRACAERGWTMAYRASSAHAFPGLIPGYLEPSRLGVDRWLALVAASAQDASGSVVVDAGSALTLDSLAPGGRHEGGWIVPGLLMGRDALFRGTGRVRGEADWQWLEEGVPRHTAEAVAQGLLRQSVGLIRDVTEQLAARWRTAPRVVLTGGDASALLPGLAKRLGEEKIMLAPDLVLDGLLALAKIHCEDFPDSLNSSPLPP